jgi:hypothetical protein
MEAEVVLKSLEVWKNGRVGCMYCTKEFIGQDFVGLPTTSATNRTSRIFSIDDVIELNDIYFSAHSLN